MSDSRPHFFHALLSTLVTRALLNSQLTGAYKQLNFEVRYVVA